MAPPVGPRKTPKSASKPLEKPIAKSKKMKKKNLQSFSIYVYKLLKTVNNMGISKKGVMIMNSFINDMLERIAVEASRLVAHGKKSTLGSQEIQSAAKLLLPGELREHANIEGLKALSLYKTSHSQDSMNKT